MPQPVRFFDVVTLAAIFLGPVFAVLVSMRREETRRKAERKFAVFHALMTTREEGLAPEHISALRSVQVDFASDKSVVRAWRSYIDHLNTPAQGEGLPRWGERRVQLFVERLRTMSETLGYGFDETDIKRMSYRPRWRDDWEGMQGSTAQNWAEIVAGRKPLRVATESGAPADTQTPASVDVEKRRV